MKRSLLPVGVLLLMAGSVTNSNAQRMTALSFQDSCRKLIGMNFPTVMSVSTTSTAVGCMIETNWGDGSVKSYEQVLSSGSAGYIRTIHYFSGPGTYTVKNVLICNGARIDSSSSTTKVGCALLGGKIFYDANANCVADTNEKLVFPLSKMQVDSAGIVVDTVYTYGTWRYGVQSTNFITYKFTLVDTPNGYTTSCVANRSITYNFNPSIPSATNLNFGLACSGTYYDNSIGWSKVLRAATSGGASYIHLYVSNNSCNRDTGTVVLHVSPKYTIASSFIQPAPTSVVGNTVTWAVSHLFSNVMYSLVVPVVPKSTTVWGDTACNHASVTSKNDADLSNNILSSCDTVRGSYDPNEKSVSSNGPIQSGSLLKYTIDFENLGNDTAFNIHVQDTLSQYLDVNTFRLIGATHAVVPIISQAGTSNIIRFDFANIMLPGKNVPQYNKGQVQFYIKMKDGLDPGTNVLNRAGIYFDGNDVVLTNYATSRIPVPEDVADIANNKGVLIYPNPASSTVYIQTSSSGWQEAVLSNVQGQVVERKALEAGSASFSISALPAGLYYLQFKGKAGSLSRKVVKH